MPSSPENDASLSASTRLTRRQMAPALAFLAAAPVLPSSALANPQQPAPLVPAKPDDALQKAHDQVSAMSERLRQADVPMDLEPAFVFRP